MLCGFCLCVYVYVSLLDTTPTSSYHNTSGQWAAATAGIKVGAEGRELSAAATAAAAAVAECSSGSGGLVFSNRRQSLVAQEAVKSEVCRTFCLLDTFGEKKISLK